MLALMYNCGLRRGEVGLLMRDDYRRRGAPHGRVLVYRLKRRDAQAHEIPLWNRTKRLLEAYLRSRRDHLAPLFLSQKGSPIGPQGVYYAFRRAARAAGLPEDLHFPHSLRHSIATHLVNMGVDLVDVQEHLGHKKIDSTLVYAKVLNPRKVRTALRAQSSHYVASF